MLLALGIMRSGARLPWRRWSCKSYKTSWIGSTGIAIEPGESRPTLPGSAEEIGELAQALRKGDRDQQLQEFGDVLAWTASLANLAGLSLEEALSRYRTGCPRCSKIPCHCP